MNRSSTPGARSSIVGHRSSAVGHWASVIWARPRHRSDAGFTLIEVLIAVLILAMSLSVLLTSQSASMAAASRSREITTATLLARAKMIDIEKRLVDEGFTAGDLEEEGDFGEEGNENVKWKYKVSEVELDLSLIKGLCEGYGADKEEGTGGGEAGACDRMTSALGGPLEQLATGIGQSMRLVDLTVTMPGNGPKSAGEKVELRTLVTREDMNVLPGQVGGQGVPGVPGAGTGTGIGTGAGGTTPQTGTGTPR